jgi:hypothetical protein
MDPNIPAQPVVQPSPKKKLPQWLTTVTLFSKLLAMALFIALPFAGFYLGMKYQEKITVSNPVTLEVQKTPTSTSKPIPSTSPISTSSPNIDASSWKTYTNTTFHLSFNYPDYFYIKSQDANSVKFGNSNLDPENTVLTISKTFTNHPPFIKEDACTVDVMPCFVEGPNVLISEVTGKSFDEISDPSGFRFFQFINPQLEISITYGGADPDHISDNIISTFKFTQ